MSESQRGGDLYIVDNSDANWKVSSYLSEWCDLSNAIDIATGYFEIGALLSLKERWQEVDRIRILMGDEVSMKTKRAFAQGLRRVTEQLDGSLEDEKAHNDFLEGVPAIVEAIRAGKIQCRVYRRDKFHAKCYITHGRLAVLGSFALVGSSNFTYPGLNDNVELNVQLGGNDVRLLQEWYERHWQEAEEITPEILRTLERHVSPRSSPRPGAQAVFFCFRIPRPDPNLIETETGQLRWSDTAGFTVWARYDLNGQQVLTDAAAIARFICSTPETPRSCALERALLTDIRKQAERQITVDILRPLQAPLGVTPILKCWMELH